MRGRRAGTPLWTWDFPPSCGLVRRSPKREALNGAVAAGTRPEPLPREPAAAVPRSAATWPRSRRRVRAMRNPLRS